MNLIHQQLSANGASVPEMRTVALQLNGDDCKLLLSCFQVTDVIKKISRDENATSQLSETSLRSRSSSRVASPILYELQIQLQVSLRSTVL